MTGLGSGYASWMGVVCLAACACSERSNDHDVVAGGGRTPGSPSITSNEGGASAGEAGSGGAGGESASVCGDGLIDEDEECDDGDTDRGDGCSATCTIEPAIEPSGPPSCLGASDPICQDGDCCSSLLVTDGETLALGEVGNELGATVSAVYLDEYEVTVGLFREFALNYDAFRFFGPHTGAGAHPTIDGSGWNEAWPLPADKEALIAALDTGGACTWSETSGANDHLPMTCVDWYLAFAFCMWDGGRLPTEVEWEYAAAGAAENRSYPWGEEEPDATRAVYGADAVSLLEVGSKPLGAARFGQLDMAGSVAEWVFDSHEPYPSDVGLDYASVSEGAARSVRGGSWQSEGPALTSAHREGRPPADWSETIGLRCARDTL